MLFIYYNKCWHLLVVISWGISWGWGGQLDGVGLVMSPTPYLSTINPRRSIVVPTLLLMPKGGPRRKSHSFFVYEWQCNQEPCSNYFLYSKPFPLF